MRRFALLAVAASLATLPAVPVVSSAAAPVPQTTPKPKPTPTPTPVLKHRTDPMMQLSGADR